MSRVENIETGERMMTEGNALRHYISKGKKALSSGEYKRMHDIWNESSRILNSCPCYKCVHDDFGYCELRYDRTVTTEEMFVKYCFPSVIKWWEAQLKEILKRKGKVRRKENENI